MSDNKTSISYFLDKIAGRGIATPNRYKIRIYPPRGIQQFAEISGVSPFAVFGQYQSTANIINMNGLIDIMAAQVSLPSRMLELMEVRTYGPKQKLPFGVSATETVSMLFLSSSWYAERHYFELWQSIIANFRSNTMNYPNEYLGRVEIITLDREGNEGYKVMLEEAFPSAVQQIDLSYSTNNTPVYTPVSWSYRNWSSPIKLGG